MRVSRKSNFTDREAPSGKYSTCEKWPSMCLRNYGQHFTAETGPVECRMLAQILRKAFSPQFQAVHKIPSGSRSAARKKVARGPLTLFPEPP